MITLVKKIFKLSRCKMKDEKEYVKELKSLYEKHKEDLEQLHIYADHLMIDRLREYGDNELADLYEKISSDFWYA